MQLETFDLGPAGKEPGCIDASDGVAVARRGLKSVRGLRPVINTGAEIMDKVFRAS